MNYVKAALAILFSTVFALGAAWLIYKYANAELVATMVGALILIVRDIISKLFGMAGKNGNGTTPKP